MHGLHGELSIISERWNTVVTIGTSGVVAKAATLGDLARVDSAAAFQTELSVSSCLQRAGVAVQEPYKVIGLQIIDGFPITFWHEIEGRVGEATETAMLASLADLHRNGTMIKLNKPWFSIVTIGISEAIDFCIERDALNKEQATKLRKWLEILLNRLDRFELEQGLVHGDAQRKNAFAVRDIAIWIDLEDCCIGPYAWDIACLTMNPAYETQRVLETYARLTETEIIPVAAIDELKCLRDLEAATWMIAIQPERDAAFHRSAANLLHKVFSDASDG